MSSYRDKTFKKPAKITPLPRTRKKRPFAQIIAWSLGFKQKEGEEKERREGGGENWNIMMESKTIIDQKIKA